MNPRALVWCTRAICERSQSSSFVIREIVLLFRREEIGIAGEEPSAINLPAEEAHCVAAGSRRLAVRHLNRDCEACAGAGNVACDDALLEIGIGFHASALHRTI